MKTSNPISSVKKLTIGGFTFCVFNSHGNILYFVFYANFFVLRKRKGICFVFMLIVNFIVEI